jgi:hypothetical protein
MREGGGGGEKMREGGRERENENEKMDILRSQSYEEILEYVYISFLKLDRLSLVFKYWSSLHKFVQNLLFKLNLIRLTYIINRKSVSYTFWG